MRWVFVSVYLLVVEVICALVFVSAYLLVVVVSCALGLCFSVPVGCGGDLCSGSLLDTEPCEGEEPRHCEWNSWGSWGDCSETDCGKVGSQNRSRTVRY